MKIFKTKLFVLCSFLFIVILNILCLIKCFNYQIEIRDQESKIQNHQIDSVLFDKLFSTLEYSIKCSNFKLCDTLSIENEESETYKMSQLIGENEVLVYRFNYQSCVSCVDSELERIDSLCAVLGKDRVLVLASYPVARDLYYQFKYHKPTFQMYNLKKGLIENSIDMTNMPYFFVVNNKLEATHFFIPNKDFPELTKLYYEKIISELSN